MESIYEYAPGCLGVVPARWCPLTRLISWDLSSLRWIFFFFFFTSAELPLTLQPLILCEIKSNKTHWKQTLFLMQLCTIEP